MVDITFFPKQRSFTLKEIAEIGNCEIFSKSPDEDLLIENVATIESAKTGEVTFITNVKYLKYIDSTKASACIISNKLSNKISANIPLLVSTNPHKSYALIARSFYPEEVFEAGISPMAAVHKSAKIGKGCTIEPFAYIGENVLMGSNSFIGSGVWVGPNVVIGDNCRISANSAIQYSLIGNNVTIHSGVKIGQDGFGFASDAKGHTRIPQLGRVIICDDVNIGANTCIDRGAINDTIIGKGTQIDNLVQIGHNVEIGNHCVIVAQVGIAGSTKIRDFVVIGGQVGIAGHLEIGQGVQIAAQAGVAKDIAAGEAVGGSPAIPLIEWKRQIVELKKLIKKNNS
jgi:UDP-3-O-[3-hydroxymyristoyl] glucosamine N-acyltransferase